MQSISHPPGFYFFERGWLSSNNILLIDDEQATLIDTGYVTHAEQTLALIQSHLADRLAIFSIHICTAIIVEAMPSCNRLTPMPRFAFHQVISMLCWRGMRIC